MILTTKNGKADTTTAPVDVSVRPASVTAIDGSRQENILLAPHIVADLTDAAYIACGAKRRKRQTLTACVISDTALQDAAENLVRIGLRPEKIEAVGAAALALIVSTALGLWASTGSIPNAVSIDLGKSTQTPASHVIIFSTTARSTSTSSSSSVTPTSSTTTALPQSKSRLATSTASTSTISHESCWKYTGTDLGSNGFYLDTLANTNVNDPPDSEPRVRCATKSLENRARPTTANHIGSCALSKPVRTIPRYWEWNEVMSNMPPQQWWFIPSQDDISIVSRCHYRPCREEGRQQSKFQPR